MTDEELKAEAIFFRDTTGVPRIKRMCQEFLDRLAAGTFPKPSKKRVRAAYMRKWRSGEVGRKNNIFLRDLP